MQATMRMALVNGFKHKLEEGSAVTLSRYSLGEIQPKYRMVNKPLHLSFLSNTIIEPCPILPVRFMGLILDHSIQ